MRKNMCFWKKNMCCQQLLVQFSSVQWHRIEATVSMQLNAAHTTILTESINVDRRPCFLFNWSWLLFNCRWAVFEKNRQLANFHEEILSYQCVCRPLTWKQFKYSTIHSKQCGVLILAASLALLHLYPHCIFIPVASLSLLHLDPRCILILVA